MTETIELHDSDVAAVDTINGAIHIEFSEVYIWSEKKGWGQKACLILENAHVREKPDMFPVTISEGILNGEDIQFENIVPLLFSEQGAFIFEFSFTNSQSLKVTGLNPRFELIGERYFIEEAGNI